MTQRECGHNVIKVIFGTINHKKVLNNVWNCWNYKPFTSSVPLFNVVASLK